MRERGEGTRLDLATQAWVRRTGRSVRLDRAPWLHGPVGDPAGIGDRWLATHAEATGTTVRTPAEGGLLPRLEALDGPGFHAADLHPTVADFYLRTARWELDVWSGWSRWAEPGGRLIHHLFARRLGQLALPLDPLATAHGLDSRVLWFVGPDGGHRETAWQRTLRSTGETVFGGCYGVARPPRARRPSVRVAFPLPNGRLTVLLRPAVTSGGGLALISPPGPHGAEGAYLLVQADDGTHAHVRRVPLPERFDVGIGPDGQLRCDHRLWLGSAPVLRLHYRLRPLG